MLSERLRPDVECAPWVIEEVKKLEDKQKPLVEALENIRKHQSFIGKTMQDYGVIYKMADEALKGVE